MRTYILSYVATAVVFLAIDAVWLTVMANALYRPALGNMMLEKPNLPAAAAFYILYILGTVIFAVAPAFNSGQWQTALVYGALFGFFAYATYDLTNQATLKNWPPIVTFADLCWGTALTALSATLGYLIVKAILKAIGA